MPLAWLSAQRAVQTLEVYFIDAEGGYATLYVSPSGQSMLVDTGYDGFEGRDATRIWAAAARAGVKQIDYLITTRDHGDHVGRDGACGASPHPQLRRAIRAQGSRHEHRSQKGGGRAHSTDPARLTKARGLGQRHYSLLGNRENMEEFIVKVGDVDTRSGLQLSARADGRFALANARTGQTTAYAAR